MRSIRIPLHSTKYPGLFAIVDEADAELVNQYRWFVSLCGNTFYAYRQIEKKTVYLHRMLTSAPKGTSVDHQNHDGLDNRQCNLRVCSHSENLRNRSGLPTSNTTGFLGVEQTSSGRFRALIWIKRVRKIVGVFDSADEAARARDNAARTHYGEFATFNFPESQS